ncbi:MAG TPA: helix-turn-helix domain-containing protein [Nitriliruptorales bacterium]
MVEPIEVRTAAQLGAAVRSARLEADLSQQVLAQRAGVSRRWISELERGKARVEWYLVLAVVQALGMTVILTPDASPVADELAPEDPDW